METQAQTETQTTEAPESTEATVETHEGETQSETTYANGKYNSVSALEEGYANLQKSYSQKLGKFTGAPEDGYSLEGEGLEGNPVLEAWGKENQLSNEGYNALVKSMNEDAAAKAEAFKTEQLQRLGENADYRLRNIVDFAKANFGEESVATLDNMIQTAEGVELIEKLIKGQKGADRPAEVKANPIDADKVKEMRFAVDKNGNRRMSVDPEYRARVESLEKELFAK